MKTKNYEMWLRFYFTYYDWALPLKITGEWLSHDYFEIDLQILCFWFNFTRMSNEYLAKLNALEIGQNQG